MKTGPHVEKLLLVGILGIVFALTFALSARAQILTVDITDPSAVVITATGLGPMGTASTTYYNGISLADFFTGYVDEGAFSTPTANSLTTGDASAGPQFNIAQGAVGAGETYADDLNLYSTIDPSALTFTSGLPAFTGSLTLNLTGYTMPSLGSHTVLSGYGPSAIPVGTYNVVTAPEPSTWMLIALGFITVVVVRSRRARA